ncbi:MAG: DUF362 domain-containing protein [Chloroflexota bacterium]|nr:MAG: DUF362 domain-containing protein [Chloroflexota bacterium]
MEKRVRMLDDNRDRQPPEGKLLSRREFLKGISLVGALALIPSFLYSCIRQEQPTPQLLPSLPIPAGRVSLVRTRNRMEGVRRAIKLLQCNPVQGKAVVLKPNYNFPLPAPCCTHDDTVRSLIQTLREMGTTHITMAERSWCEISTRRVLEEMGIFNLAEELDIDIVNLQETEPDEWVHLHPNGSQHWNNGFEFPRVYHEAQSIVQTCLLKTHGMGGNFTMSLKNAVGMLRPGPDYTPPLNEWRGTGNWPWGRGHPYYPWLGEMHRSPHIRKMIAEINLAYKPDIVVLDGVDAFVTGGPTEGKVAATNVILAGSDRVAIDAVGVAILRLFDTTPAISDDPIFEQEQIARAAELDLGIKTANQIQLITDDSKGEAFAAQIRDILLKG